MSDEKDERHLRISRRRRHLVNLLENDDPYVEGIESIKGCEHLAQLLFELIYEAHGEQEARRIFAQYATPPDQQELAELGLLDRLSFMPPLPNGEPNASELSRQIAAERGTDHGTELRHIRRVKKRHKGRVTNAEIKQAEIRSLQNRITRLREKIFAVESPEAKAAIEADIARLQAEITALTEG